MWFAMPEIAASPVMVRTDPDRDFGAYFEPAHFGAYVEPSTLGSKTISENSDADSPS